MPSLYDQTVATRYHIYNSLFLNLPFSDIYRTGTLLPLLQQCCEEGFKRGQEPKTIIKNFFRDYVPNATRDEQFALLFNFIQYTERQVVLFDSIEEGAFAEINDLNGRGTIPAFLLRANSQQVTDKLLQKLQDFSVRIVLTAHPTQFYPGHVLAIINDLELAIRQGNLNQINLLLQQLGKTAFINREKPTPYDEAVSLCWYLENVFYHVIPDIINKFANGLGVKPEDWKNFNLIKIGFWPGGDRDGNPYVTHDITLKVANRLRETVLKAYHRDVRILRRRLTFKGVDSLVINVEQRIYNALYNLDDQYTHPSQVIADLREIRDVLIKQHDGLFLNLLDTFLLKINIFGFYLASMDIRQDSRKHAEGWNEIIEAVKTKQKSLATLEGRSEEEQIKIYLKTNFSPTKLTVGSTAKELIESMVAIASIQKQNGEEGCHRYVISNCQSALDVIRIYQLAKLILGKDGNVPLDIVPLFETIEDLKNAPEIMNRLYSIPEYKEHLIKRNSKQTIMVGFSDGTKDGGYLRANWSIFRAKENLTTISRQHDVMAIFFDGRGGPPARGGGNTHDFYASLGDTVEAKEVQITIQGQTISSNFGKPVSCSYNVEQLLSAGLENAVFHNPASHLQQQSKELLEDLAEEGYAAYLDLKHHPKFVPYLEKITPLAYFGEIKIGSRPVKRSASAKLKLEDLRAIPFVGSWAQMKQNIPGFYGVGTALKQMKKKGTFKEFKKLYQQSLFFRTLIGNSMMSLTKSYYPATAYLSKDKEFGEFWKKMFDEFKLSKEVLLEVSDQPELMESNPHIRESIKLRERIVLPLIAIQQCALQQLRNPDDGEDKFQQNYRKLVMRCMFGIINAARNSA